MKLARVAAVLLLLQGVAPAFVFGFWRPGGFFLLVVAAIYALLAWGVWASKRWALFLAMIFTVPQLMVISSKLFSWQFYIGGTFGVGVAPSSSLLDTRLTSFCSWGARFDFAVSERCPSLLAGYAFIHSETFILLNVFALLIFTTLLAALRRCRESVKPSPPIEGRRVLDV
jgi:hypothetical protein